MLLRLLRPPSHAQDVKINVLADRHLGASAIGDVILDDLDSISHHLAGSIGFYRRLRMIRRKRLNAWLGNVGTFAGWIAGLAVAAALIASAVIGLR